MGVLVRPPKAEPRGAGTLDWALSRVPLLQLPNLLHMMQPMHQVKVPPLFSTQRPENGMIQQCRRPSAFSQRAIMSSISPIIAPISALRQHFPHGQPAWTGRGWSVPSGRQITETEHDQPSPTMCPGRARRHRLLRFGHTAESFGRSGVGQIKMLQHFRGAPLARRIQFNCSGVMPAMTDAIRSSSLLRAGSMGVTYLFRRFG
jgi:hypothetical protein